MKYKPKLPKYKKGDKVILVSHKDNCENTLRYLGQVGTILESSKIPQVQFSKRKVICSERELEHYEGD